MVELFESAGKYVVVLLFLHNCSNVIVFVTDVLILYWTHQCSGVTEGVWSNVTTFTVHHGGLLSWVFIDCSIVFMV